MSFSKEETIQEKIKELSVMDSRSEQYFGEYNKTLKAIVNLKEIYTVVSRNTIIKADHAPCTLNGFTAARNGEIIPE